MLATHWCDFAAQGMATRILAPDDTFRRGKKGKITIMPPCGEIGFAARPQRSAGMPKAPAAHAVRCGTKLPPLAGPPRGPGGSGARPGAGGVVRHFPEGVALRLVGFPVFRPADAGAGGGVGAAALRYIWSDDRSGGYSRARCFAQPGERGTARRRGLRPVRPRRPASHRAVQTAPARSGGCRGDAPAGRSACGA